MSNIRYAVLEFELENGFLEITSYIGNYDDIKDAEKERVKFIEQYSLNPLMVQVIQYAE